MTATEAPGRLTGVTFSLMNLLQASIIYFMYFKLKRFILGYLLLLALGIMKRLVTVAILVLALGSLVLCSDTSKPKPASSYKRYKTPPPVDPERIPDILKELVVEPKLDPESLRILKELMIKPKPKLPKRDPGPPDITKLALRTQRQSLPFASLPRDQRT